MTSAWDDVYASGALSDPYAFYARLREHGPVHWSEANRAWFVTSHSEVSAAFREPNRLSSDRLGPLASRMSAEERAALDQTFELLRGWMVFRDPPIHGRLRSPVHGTFTPRRVDRLTARIRTLVEERLDALSRRGRCELVSDFAYPLPAIVIAELLGVPAHDRERFQLWSRKLSGLVFGVLEREERNRAASEASAEFSDYFSALVREREAEPRDDLISALVAARDRDDALDPKLVVGACTMLLFAGHETTTRLITNAIACLLEYPAERERLSADPNLATLAVEEYLRFQGPAHTMVRYVGEPHERAGHKLEPGQRVYLCMAGANRDPSVFPDPDRFDVGRDPNPHLAFGFGPHFCLGAHLARVETRLAIDGLLARFPRLRLDATSIQWHYGLLGGGIGRLPLRLD